jgi:hypothetical protein
MPRGLPDGYRTLVTFADFPSIQLFAKKVTPPGIEGGDGIDTTTMLNDRWKTKYPQSLIEATPLNFTAAYKPEIYVQAVIAVNLPQYITVTFPNGDSVGDYGWLRSIKPNSHEIGAQPTAECVVEFGGETFADPVVETGLTYVASV